MCLVAGELHIGIHCGERDQKQRPFFLHMIQRTHRTAVSAGREKRQIPCICLSYENATGKRGDTTNTILMLSGYHVQDE